MARGRVWATKRNYSYDKKHVRYVLLSPTPEFFHKCGNWIDLKQGEAIIQTFLQDLPKYDEQKIVLLQGELAICLDRAISLTVEQQQFLLGLQDMGLIEKPTIECWIEQKIPLNSREKLLRNKSCEKSQWRCVLTNHKARNVF